MTRTPRSERDIEMLAAAARTAPVRARTNNGRAVIGALIYWPVPGIGRRDSGGRPRIRTLTGVYLSVDPDTVHLIGAEPIATATPSPDYL